MTMFYELSCFCRALFAIWVLLICCAAITGIVLSSVVKHYQYVFVSLSIFALSYLLRQLIMDLNHYGSTKQTAGISVRMGSLPWLIWMFALILLTLAAVISLIFDVRDVRRYITPLSIKQCADRMTCGICYWRGNGRVILSNHCMNSICISLTRKPLLNGCAFRNSISGESMTVGDRVWNFACRELVFDKETLYEMIAWDVTELHRKAEILRKDNEKLSMLKKQLNDYALKIDDMVRSQEILQAKINIHDEMNRLLMSTASTDIKNKEEINSIFALWKRDTILLCREADESRDKNAIEQINALAQALGVHLVWNGDLPDSLNIRQKELFFMAAREAVANAVKHAQAQKIEIAFEEKGSSVCCSFENDGSMPDSDIHFTGGLKNLAFLAENQDAGISVTIEETFKLGLFFDLGRGI